MQWLKLREDVHGQGTALLTRMLSRNLFSLLHGQLFLNIYSYNGCTPNIASWSLYVFALSVMNGPLFFVFWEQRLPVDSSCKSSMGALSCDVWLWQLLERTMAKIWVLSLVWLPPSYIVDHTFPGTFFHVIDVDGKNWGNECIRYVGKYRTADDTLTVLHLYTCLLQPRPGPKLESEKLLIRGEEAKFLNK